ncbi:MAG: metal ABC transporter permease [Actinomycetota bacterium]|nr:metal ABC transporter permease [Actinomycetota bacterium]
MTWPPFLLHALLAGTVIAAAVGLVGYFVVLRAQVFTGDALSHVAFTGALAALALGIDERFGLFVATIGVGVALGALGGRGRADDVVIGSVFAWILGLGVYFLTLFSTTRSASNSSAGVEVLFGSIFGLNLSQAVTAAIVAVAIAAAMVAIARPLLFASIDGAVAAARGIPVRVLSYGFLALVGAAAAEATQAVGALLLLGLLAAPAGTAQRLTTRPYLALLLSAGLAVAAMWVGLALSYTLPALPPSFAILAVAAGGYALALFSTRRRPSNAPPAAAQRVLGCRGGQ